MKVAETLVICVLCCNRALHSLDGNDAPALRKEGRKSGQEMAHKKKGKEKKKQEAESS